VSARIPSPPPAFPRIPSCVTDPAVVRSDGTVPTWHAYVRGRTGSPGVTAMDPPGPGARVVVADPGEMSGSGEVLDPGIVPGSPV